LFINAPLPKFCPFRPVFQTTRRQNKSSHQQEQTQNTFKFRQIHYAKVLISLQNHP